MCREGKKREMRNIKVFCCLGGSTVLMACHWSINHLYIIYWHFKYWCSTFLHNTHVRNNVIQKSVNAVIFGEDEMFWLPNLKSDTAVSYNSWCENKILSKAWYFRVSQLQSDPVSWSSVSQNCMSLSCKKTHCKLLWTRNWFWLRSSHLFSLFTILQVTFSSTSWNSPVSAPFSTLSARSLWLLMLNVKPCCWCQRLLKEPLPCTVPQATALHTSSSLFCDHLLSSLHPAATWPLLYPSSSSSWLFNTRMTLPHQSGQHR